MIPGVDLVSFIQTVSLLGVAFVIFAESGLLIGFFLPGDSLLFTTGFLMYTGILPINLFIAIPVLFIAAALGDSVGYAFGRRVGERIFSRPDARIFKHEYIERAQTFYEKNGSKTIILARFIPVVRTFAPIVAGAGSMPYKRFLTFNLVGAFLWTVGVTSAGFLLGKTFKMMGLDIDQVLLPIVATIIIVSLLPPLIHILRDKKTRGALQSGVKRRFASIFRKRK
ncbi:MAG: DedA family protein [Candidatus Microsaccharimonas sossegonensis]|uniref:DedA family protein n=1 Tax=Candidatus Microsaccharimonas sossegonensis TaxID=2506948 RepID=A0A4Q0AGR2_9BACT|nr:MAG: DedA family protein [Candidatus Microsaccharimonas sossegonensis]